MSSGGRSGAATVTLKVIGQRRRWVGAEVPGSFRSVLALPLSLQLLFPTARPEATTRHLVANHRGSSHTEAQLPSDLLALPRPPQHTKLLVSQTDW